MKRRCDKRNKNAFETWEDGIDCSDLFFNIEYLQIVDLVCIYIIVLLNWGLKIGKKMKTNYFRSNAYSVIL